MTNAVSHELTSLLCFFAGVLFDHQATLELINQYGARKEPFDRAHNKREFWEEVCADVQAKHPHLNLTWQGCERKWLALRSTYFDFRNDANTSGSDGVTMTWPYYDPKFGGQSEIHPRRRS